MCVWLYVLYVISALYFSYVWVYDYECVFVSVAVEPYGPVVVHPLFLLCGHGPHTLLALPFFPLFFFHYHKDLSRRRTTSRKKKCVRILPGPCFIKSYD